MFIPTAYWYALLRRFYVLTIIILFWKIAGRKFWVVTENFWWGRKVSAYKLTKTVFEGTRILDIQMNALNPSSFLIEFNKQLIISIKSNWKAKLTFFSCEIIRTGKLTEKRCPAVISTQDYQVLMSKINSMY